MTGSTPRMATETVIFSMLRVIDFGEYISVLFIGSTTDNDTLNIKS